MAVKKMSRKCPKCGMKLGQKNICPVCDKSSSASGKTADTKSAKARAESDSEFSPALANLLEPFVKENQKNWNNKFDDFYDSLKKDTKKEVDYRTAVKQCKRWSLIFAEIQTLLKKSRVLSADLVIEIMDKIPKKFPEITDSKARSLAREFAQNAPRGDYQLLFMPEDGKLCAFPKQNVKYTPRAACFSYVSAETGRKNNIPVPFDCYVRLFLYSEKRQIKKGEVIAVLDRIEDKVRK